MPRWLDPTLRRAINYNLHGLGVERTLIVIKNNEECLGGETRAASLRSLLSTFSSPLATRLIHISAAEAAGILQAKGTGKIKVKDCSDFCFLSQIGKNHSLIHDSDNNFAKKKERKSRKKIILSLAKRLPSQILAVFPSVEGAVVGLSSSWHFSLYLACSLPTSHNQRCSRHFLYLSCNQSMKINFMIQICCCCVWLWLVEQRKEFGKICRRHVVSLPKTLLIRLKQVVAVRKHLEGEEDLNFCCCHVAATGWMGLRKRLKTIENSQRKNELFRLNFRVIIVGISVEHLNDKSNNRQTTIFFSPLLLRNWSLMMILQYSIEQNRWACEKLFEFHPSCLAWQSQEREWEVVANTKPSTKDSFCWAWN